MAANNPQALKIISLLIKLFGVLPLLLGLGLLTGAYFLGSHRYTIVKKWPTVDAEVTHSEVTHHQETIGTHNRLTTVYQAQIDFRYTLGGKSYTSPTGSDYSTSNFAEMKLKVDTYAPGTHHPIRYNPENPNDISYDAGFTFGFFLAPLVLGIVGLGFTLVGAAVFYGGMALGRAKVRCPSCGEMFRYTEPVCPNCGAAYAPSPAGS
jgi:hypothetical protein